MKKLLALAAMLLAVNVWADTPWILNDSEDQLEGKFWTICSPDGKWQLACVPADPGIYVDYELQQEYDLIVTKWYWSYDDEEDVDLEDITGRDTALVKGSGVLTLPRRAFLGGDEYSIGYKDWSFGERETEWSRISKVVIESDFDTYVGDAFN